MAQGFQSPRHRGGDQLEHVAQAALITASQEAERAREVLGPDYKLHSVTPAPVSAFSSKNPQPPRVPPAGRGGIQTSVVKVQSESNYH